jgi:uncharacterized membrane protein YfcA
MTEIERQLMNYTYWHVYFDWLSPLFLGLGITAGDAFANFMRHKKFDWKRAVFFALVATAIAFSLMTVVEYIRFTYIWKDIIIEGNL